MRLRHFAVCSVLTVLLSFAGYSLANAEVKVTPHVSIREGYDSNITIVSKRDKAISDTMTRLELGVDAAYTGKLDSVKFHSSVFRQFYQSHSKFDSTNENIGVDIGHEFTRFDRISLSDNFRHGTEPGSFASIFGSTSGLYTYTVNDLNLGYTHEFTRQLSTILRYGNQVNTYNRADFSDNIANTLGATVEYALTSQNIGLVDYRYAHVGYSPGGAISTNTLSGGVRHYFSPQLSLEAMAGYEFLQDINHQSSTNPVYTVTLADSITDKLDARFSYNWETSTSAFSTDTFKNYRYSAGLTDQVNGRLKIEGSAFWGKGTYASSGIENELRGVIFGWVYQLSAHMEWTVDVNYTAQASNDPGSAYTRLLTSTGIRIEF